AARNQSGGSHSITNLSLGSGSRYLLSAGTLSVTNLYGSGTMDFTGGSGTISYSGIVDLTAAPLVFPSGVNLSGGSTSLLLLPPGFDPAQFQSLTTQGLYHSVGTPLTIPFGQTVSGVGNLT